MIEQDVKNEMTCFVDTDINAFRAEVTVLKKESIQSPIAMEAELESDKGDLWTMHFDGACCKDGLGASIILISLDGFT